MLAGAGVAAADDDTGSPPPKTDHTSAPEKAEPAATPGASNDKDRTSGDGDDPRAGEDENDDDRVDNDAENDADAEEAAETVKDVKENVDLVGALDGDRDRKHNIQVETPKSVDEAPKPPLESSEPAAEPKPPAAEPEAAEAEVAAPAHAAEAPVGQEPGVPETAPRFQSDVVTTTLSVVDPIEPDGDPANPAVPAMASLLSVVTAGREVTEQPGTASAQQASTTLVDDDAWQIPIDVEVREIVAPLHWLQEIPVLGRLVITPIVRLIHTIPLVGEIVHPLIGFPIDHDAPDGAPRARDFMVTSFDGTQIYVHFMPAKNVPVGTPAPTVLSGPGLPMPGGTTLDLKNDGILTYDFLGIGALREQGYNVVTWDPRGEWRSGGEMQLQSPYFEGRDVSTIISWLATRPEVALNGPNDPKIGMVGPSYGAGIQFATAAIDHRVDALVPSAGWSSLSDVLFRQKAVRSGWGTILSAAIVLTMSRPNPRILPAAVIGILTGYASESDLALLDDLSYTDLVGQITTPTLLLQGTVDTLFTLAQADANAKALLAAKTPTKVVWYCGGHGACLSDFNNGEVVWRESMEWLNRYVKGDTTVVTGPQFEWVDQHGQQFSSDTYPVALGEPVRAERTNPKSLAIIPFVGGSGPNPLILLRGPIGFVLGLPSAAPAANAVNLDVPDAVQTTHIVGAPKLTMTYSGKGTARNVYAQIVDNETGLVLGNQATAIPVVLDGGTHEVTVDLEQVAHTLQPGESVRVQIVASTVNFFNFYSWGSINVDSMSIELPTLASDQVSVVAA